MVYISSRGCTVTKPRSGRIDFNVPEPLKKLAEMAAARENYDTLSEYLRTKLWELVDREMTKDEQAQFLKLLYPDVELGDIKDLFNESTRSGNGDPVSGGEDIVQMRPLSPEAVQRIQDRIHARGGKTFRDSQKTGTEG